jgi:hypothetical protein
MQDRSVILGGVAVSRSEAATESKHPRTPGSVRAGIERHRSFDCVSLHFAKETPLRMTARSGDRT